MRFQLNIMLTENDYLAFNLFHALDSAEGKRQAKKSRIILLTTFFVVVVLLLFILDPGPLSITYCILLGVWLSYRIFFLRRVLTKNIKRYIKKTLKEGKRPFTPSSTIEFYEDYMVEITESTRTELRYNAFEKICVVDNQHIFLYNTGSTAFIICIPQIQTQANPLELLHFLSEKCGTVEYY